TFAAIRDGHRRGAGRSLADARPDMPRALAGVVDRALSADPGARFESVASMEAAIAALAPGATRSVARPYRLGVAAIAVVALVVLAVAAVERVVAPHGASGMVIRRVAEHAPLDGSSSGLSSDGRFVSHVDWATTGNLVVTDLTTGTTRALTGK